MATRRRRSNASARVTAALVGLLWQLLLLDPSGAADYPSRPIKLLVGASAGGTTDTMARTIAQPLSSLFGVPVLVDLRSPRLNH
jgi:tripartite-type tricarboxylate transporter receptor subunit TctC